MTQYKRLDYFLILGYSVIKRILKLNPWCVYNTYFNLIKKKKFRLNLFAIHMKVLSLVLYIWEKYDWKVLLLKCQFL